MIQGPKGIFLWIEQFLSYKEGKEIIEDEKESVVSTFLIVSGILAAILIINKI